MQAQTLDELYRKAMSDGVVNFYGTLAQVNAEKILPVFEKRFPGIKINQVDITSNNLVEEKFLRFAEPLLRMARCRAFFDWAWRLEEADPVGEMFSLLAIP